MTKNLRILIVYPNIPMMLVTPLAVAEFTWILRKEGYEVELFDATQYADEHEYSPQKRVKYLQARNIFAKENLEFFENEEMESHFRKKLEAFNPDLLLYSFAEDSLRRALQLLRVSNPYGIPTIIGGILATAAPEWLLSFPEIGIVCVGEGEEVVRDVALKLARGNDIRDVPNLWIRNDDGSIMRNTMRPYVDLDDYSTDFSLFDESRFVRPMGGKIHRALPLETYRGCPNRCTYCNSPMHNRIAKEHNRVYLRRKSIHKVKDELMNLVNNYAINLLYIVDDDFLARPSKEIDAFVDMYREFRVPFWFNTRPEHCTPDVLEKLQEVGLFRISFGIESGNEAFRKKYLKRSTTNEKLLYYFDVIYRSGIQYSINCIIGFPFETREMAFDTIRFVKKIRGYDAITVSVFTPYRGTILRQAAIEAGWLDPEAMTVHTTSTSMLKMPHFTARQIDGLMRTFSLYVEFDESVWPELEKAERFLPGDEDILKKYSDLYSERRWGINGPKTSG
jgi:anaerobic magnesium-protoporphyrin IX monomethyl ester cyclase